MSSREQIWRAGTQDFAHELAGLLQWAGSRGQQVKPVTEHAQRDEPGDGIVAESRDIVVERLQGEVIAMSRGQCFDQLRLRSLGVEWADSHACRSKPSKQVVKSVTDQGSAQFRAEFGQPQHRQVAQSDVDPASRPPWPRH